MNKDIHLIFENYTKSKGINLFKESDSVNTLVNFCLGNYYKELFLEYSHTKEDKAPKDKRNISVSGSNNVNLYEPNQTLTTTTPDGEDIDIHGTEREMNIERAAMSETRALLIFLTYSRLDPIIRNYLSLAGMKKETVTGNDLTPKEEVELEDLEKKDKRVRNHTEFWNTGQKERYIELSRKKNRTAKTEMIITSEEREKVKKLVTRRLLRLCGDDSLKEQIEDIVEFMFDFISHNPDSVELLDLPKYKEGEVPKPPDESAPNSDGHEHGGGGLGGIAASAIAHALPDIIQSAVHVLGFGGAAIAATAIGGGALLGKKIMGLLQNIKPSKALALIQGNSVRPTKDKGWEIQVNGNWEPVRVTS